MFLGAHIKTAGGLDKAIERAKLMKAEAMQIFTGSPRIWKAIARPESEWVEFADQRVKAGVRACVIHATYLINLASDKPELREKSRQALITDLTISNWSQMQGVVVHLGSHQGRGFEVSKEVVAKEIKLILEQTPENSYFLIENSAGQNGKIASNLAEIRFLLDAVDSPRLGWCLDTCHAHAAGYRLSEAHDTSGAKPKKDQGNLFETSVIAYPILGDEISRLKLWDSLTCVHVNESKDLFASGRDRHDNLGSGMIGNQALADFLAEPALTSLPVILEVPGDDGQGPDIANLERLKKLVG